MDARVDDLGTSILRAPLARRRSMARALDQEFHRGLVRVLSADRVAAWEWGLAIGALIWLSRGPALFVRLRLEGVFGPVRGGLWQDDLVLQLFVGSVCALVVVFALLRDAAGPIVRQPLLVAYVVIAWLSIAWSIEPNTSLRRSLFLLGSVVIGVYIGNRFRLRDQVRLVASASATGAGLSFIALLFWTDLATSTGAMRDTWSGFYVNRNWLALALSLGLLSLAFWASTQLRFWPVVLAVPMLALLAMTKSKTGILALAGTFGITAWVWFLRKIGAKKHGPLAGAVFVLSTVGSLGMLVHWYWTNILVALNRDPTMTSRTEIWQVVRWYVRQHPWLGWGYEAIWTNSDVIERSRLAVGRRAWGAHNGYYDIMLGLGRVGLMVFVLFLGIAAWRAFRHAWRRSDLLSFWPFSLVVFAVIVNFSESTFIAAETLFVVVVAATVATTELSRREATGPWPPPRGADR